MNGDWSAASHWSNGVPTSSTDAFIDASGTYTVNVSKSSVANTLTIDDIGATVKDNVSLKLTGALTISSGTFELDNGSLDTSQVSIASLGIFLVGQGTHALSEPIANDGTVEITGELELTGAVSGTGVFQIDPGATLQLDGAGPSNVKFVGSTGDLVLKNPAAFYLNNETIAGFTGSDEIDLTNINPAKAHVESVTYSSSTQITTLIITDGQNKDTLLLGGKDYTTSSWSFSKDGNGGTLVVDPPTSAAAVDTTSESLVTNHHLIANSRSSGQSDTEGGSVSQTIHTYSESELAGTLSGTGVFQVDAGATLQLDGADFYDVKFNGPTGDLILKDAAAFAGTIIGLSGSDEIDLANIASATAKVSSVYYSTSSKITTLTITDEHHTDTIKLQGNYTNSEWTLSDDGNGGTLVVDPPVSSASAHASAGDGGFVSSSRAD